MTLTPGARLGPYEVVASIGLGGMGEAFGAVLKACFSASRLWSQGDRTEAAP